MGDISENTIQKSQLFINNFITSNFDDKCLSNIKHSHLYSTYGNFTSNYDEKEKRIEYKSSNYDMNKFLYSYNNLSFNYLDKLFDNSDSSNSSNTKTFINYLCYKALSNIDINYSSHDHYYDICKNIKPVVKNLLYDESKSDIFQSNLNIIIDRGNLNSNTVINDINYDKSAIDTNKTDCYLFKSNKITIYKVDKILNINNLNVPIFIDIKNDYIYLFYKKKDNVVDTIIYKYYNKKFKCLPFVLETFKQNIDNTSISTTELTTDIINELNNNIITINHEKIFKEVQYCGFITNDIFVTYNSICCKIINSILLLNTGEVNKLKNAYSQFNSLN